tara:strand:- start:16313 stop:16657 length:345 start_codon:yes stop_codon:yes gene_type:complete
MFTVKIRGGKKNNILSKTAKTISNFLKIKLNKNTNIISDNSSIEMIAASSSQPLEDNNQLIAELFIKKTIVINNSDLEDREKLDKFLSEIKYFCEQASKIEDAKYVPLEFRKRE